MTTSQERRVQEVEQDERAAALRLPQLQSLFGYAAEVHVRGGGVCQLCGAGDRSFDWWRQLTVEHLIGEGQGGYLRAIRGSLAVRYPGWTAKRLALVARELDEINTVSACSFCNSTTSRDRAPISMTELILGAGDEADLETAVRRACGAILDRKRADVAWKLESVQAAFQERVLPLW